MSGSAKESSSSFLLVSTSLGWNSRIFLLWLCIPPFEWSVLEKEWHPKFTTEHNFSGKFYSEEGGNSIFLLVSVPAGSVTTCVLFPNAAFLCWGSELAHKCVKLCYLTTSWGGYKLARPQVNMVLVQPRAGICVLLAAARCCSAALNLLGIPREGAGALCWEEESVIASLLLDFH